jgi:hypothetical protein
MNPLLITFQHFVKLPISFYNRIVKDSLFFLLVFNYVIFIDFYERSFCWQFCNFVYSRIMCTCTWCNQMHVSFFSQNFLTIIESIIGKIQIITPHQRMYLFIFEKSILTHALKIHTYTICTNDQNIVNDWQQYM